MSVKRFCDNKKCNKEIMNKDKFFSIDISCYAHRDRPYFCGKNKHETITLCEKCNRLGKIKYVKNK